MNGKYSSAGAKPVEIQPAPIEIQPSQSCLVFPIAQAPLLRAEVPRINAPLDMAQLTGRIDSTKPVILRLVTEQQQQVWAVRPSVSGASTNRSHRKRSEFSQIPKRRSAGNGLRQFAEDVLHKVERKKRTTYNEVADELVADMYRSPTQDFMEGDEKNVRRRVYDALNVLLAMKIITKDKKMIQWAGMPASQAEQQSRLEKQKHELQKRIAEKRQELNELIVQQVAFANLVERNRETEAAGKASPNPVVLRLPFIVVNTRKKTSVDCWMSHNRDTYQFNFSDRFEMHDDVEVLKRSGLAMGLESGNCHGTSLERALKLVGPNLKPYIIDMAVQNHLRVLSQPLSTADPERVQSSTVNVITVDDEEVETIVVSDTLQHVETTVARETNVDVEDCDDSLSDDQDSDSQSSNNDECDSDQSD